MSEHHNSTTTSQRAPAPRPRRRRRRFSVLKGFFSVLGTLILIGLTTGALLLCFAAVYIKTVIMPIAAEDSLGGFVLGEDSVMYYTDPATGEDKELVTILSTTSSIWKDYPEMPQDLINATIAIEDQRFLTHKGVDWKRTAAAVLYRFTGKDIQGGSTLTQQVVKNSTQYDDVTVKRKIVEIFSALAMDARYSKSDIITWYLNIIYLGEGCNGVGAASYKYFGKDVSELSLAECASLISITNNPSIFSPYGTLNIWDEEEGKRMTSRDYNKERQEDVLWCMWQQGMISEEEFKDACDEELVFVRAQGEVGDTTVYSWYEELVLSDVRADLIATYGYSTQAANALLSSGGLSIYTCLNPDVQADVEEIYYNRENLDYTSDSGTQKLQSAITIIDNVTGDVVAVAGRVGEKDKNLLRSLATDAIAQPGSSIKPLSVYAPAIDMGLITPYTILDDYPYALLNNSPWPRNSSGKIKGLVTVEEAVAHSYNTVAVRVLGDLVTPQASFDFMENRFHFDLVDHEEQNGQIHSDIDLAPLSMGGLTNGVNTRDMAEAYASFANSGVYRYSRTYTKVVDSNGKVILENQPQEESIMKESTAYYMTSLLEKVVDYGTGTPAQMDGIDSAGKTGTTDKYYDRWFVGYTPYYTAAVWVGYEYDEPINAHYTVSSTMWANVMNLVHEDLPAAQFHKPNDLVSFQYCMDCGCIATEYCTMDPRGSRIATGYLLRQDVPTQRCTCHTQDTVLTVCLDCPVLFPDGSETGQFHQATEHCPPERTATYSYPNYNRTLLTTSRGVTTWAPDEMYLYRSNVVWDSCTIHNGLDVDTDGDGIPDILDPNPDIDDTLIPTEPDTTEPGTTEPGTTEPGTTEPGTTEPDTTEPEPDTGGNPAVDNGDADGDGVPDPYDRFPNDPEQQ